MDEFSKLILDEINKITDRFYWSRVIENTDHTHTVEYSWAFREAEEYCENLKKVLETHNNLNFNKVYTV